MAGLLLHDRGPPGCKHLPLFPSLIDDQVIDAAASTLQLETVPQRAGERACRPRVRSAETSCGLQTRRRTFDQVFAVMHHPGKPPRSRGSLAGRCDLTPFIAMRRVDGKALPGKSWATDASGRRRLAAGVEGCSLPLPLPTPGALPSPPDADAGPRRSRIPQRTHTISTGRFQVVVVPCPHGRRPASQRSDVGPDHTVVAAGEAQAAASERRVGGGGRWPGRRGRLRRYQRAGRRSPVVGRADGVVVGIRPGTGLGCHTAGTSRRLAPRAGRSHGARRPHGTRRPVRLARAR